MIKNFLFKKIISAISIFTVLLNLMLPLFIGQQVYAQEVTPVPTEIQEISTPAPEPFVSPITQSPAPEVAASPVPEVSPEPTPSVNPVTVASEPAPSVTPSPTPVPDLTISPEVTPSAIPSPESSPTPGSTPIPFVLPVWGSLEGGGYETNKTVVTNEDYIYPENDKLRIKFTQISDPAGKLKIKQITLSPEQIEQLGALSDTAYEITSTMADGTFFYDLTLPIPPEAQNKEVDVKSSETVEEAGNAQKVSEPEEKTADTITIHGLNHFTVFILTTPAPDNTQAILINEVLPNPSAGLEWVELYNNTAGIIDLSTGTGWTIDSATGTPQGLSALGSIPAGGLKVFEAPAGWLSNTAPETITVSNETGTAIDTVTISLTSPGFAVNRYPASGESVGRSSDGNSQWIIFTSPTKGTTNVLAAPANKAVASTIEANGYPSWYGDDNGTRVGACLDGSDPRCALAGEVGFDPPNPTVFPSNFPTEFFYWSAEALMGTPGGGARLVLASEGAFANGPVAEGDQITFGRIRVRADGLIPNTDYTVIHPYGSVVIRTDGTGNLRSNNDDIGCAGNPCVFADALGSPVFDSFLRWDAGAPAGYLGDGITEHAVSGSPTGNNFFRIEGPGLPGGAIQTNNFIVLGKLFVPPVTPPAGCVDIAPDAPVLVSPANGAVGVPNSLVLNWNGIVSFGTNCLGSNNQFEIFLDPGNVDPITSWGVVSEATVSKLILALASNSTYSWKVRAKNGALFADSGVQTFTTTSAVTNRVVSPNIDPNNNFATWYGDDNGIQVAPCLDGTDPNCVLPALGESPTWVPGQVTNFPTNFPPEFFYWIAESDFVGTPGGGRASVRMALEGAFANENPIAGDQMVFGRIRFTGTGLTANSTYTVTHPYGVDTYQTDDLGTVRRNVATEDIGCVPGPGVLCDFALALNSRVFGGFLRQPSAPDGYLGDAISLRTVIGSPSGQNFVRIEGPGLPAGGLFTDLFTVSGKIFVAPPPPPGGCVDSAPNQPALAGPADAAVDVSTNPNLSWDALGSFGINCTGNIDRFQVFLDTGNVDPTTLKATILSPQTSANILNLLSGTTYSWKVRASNGVLTTDSLVRTFTTTVSTANKAVSPTNNANNGYPDWYRDDLGTQVVPCIDGTDPVCVLPGPGEEPNFDPTQPTDFPGNFPSEFFYWIADSNPLVTPGGGDVSIRYAAEGAFANGGPVPGDQMVFGRIRVRATGLLPNLQYTATHAYGVDVYSTDENGNITSVLATEDIGCVPAPGAPCDFTQALASRIFGGFLSQAVGAPAGYIGDGVTVGEVTGSPLNQNFFRIEGPGLPVGGLETNLFTVSGKLFVAGPPVPDVTAPVITVLGANPVDVLVGSVYNDAGATALDNVDGDLTASIVTVNPVNSNVIGTYTVTYNVSDAAVNPATEATRTVNVVAAPPVPDTIAPVITLLGVSPVTVTVGTTYTDAGATALDDVDGDITANIITVNPVNTAVIGIYTVTYNVSDAAVNPATEVTRTVNVVAAAPVQDITVPVITLLGTSPVNVTVGTAYVDAGAIALDNIDGDITANIITVNPVNTAVIGVYTVTYNVSDAASNPAIEVTRTVNVVAVAPPVDITAPSLLSFTSTTADGTYGPGASINITANFDEPVGVDSTATVTLDIGVLPIELVALSLVSGNTLSGNYVVGPTGSGENSPDLTVISINSMNVTDVAGNLQTSTTLPASNIADTSAIVIDTTVPPPPPATTGTITIIKDAIPDSAQDFGFRVRNGAFDQSFLLDDDGNLLNDLSNTRVFEGLTPGVYTAQENGPANNWVLSTILCFDPDSGTTVDMPSRTATINLIAGGNVICTFTNTLNRSISGIKFEDVNGNSVKDAGEPGLSGWTIYLDASDNGVLDLGETSILTDVGGNYLFSNLSNIVYNVREVLQTGWTQTVPASDKYTVDLSVADSAANQDFGNVASLVTSGGLVGYSGSNTATPSIVALESLTFSSASNGGTSTVSVPAGTVITPVDGGNIDATQVTASTPSASSLSGLAGGAVIAGVLQWGIPDLGLQFSNPITLNIFVGTAFNGLTLNVTRSVTPGGPWVSEGIVAPATCLVSAGICSFQATKASFYVAAHTEEESTTPSPTPTPSPAPTSTPTPAPGSSSTTTSSSGGGDGLSDGLGCASHDCSIHPEASLQGQASADSANDFTAEVLGAQAGEDNFGTGTGGPIIEESPSPSSEVLGVGDGNVGIGGINQAGVTNQPFLGFMQTQRSLLGILVGLIVLFGSNILFRRKVSQK